MKKKAGTGNFFEAFHLGQQLHHPTPRTITSGDTSLYIALTGSRFLLHSSSEAATSLHYEAQLVDDLLVFHIAFGKTVADISVNAIANLGYADVQFLLPVYVGDTISVSSEVIGLRENKNAKSGIVYVHSSASNQHGRCVLTWKRWVMVHKQDHTVSNSETCIPELVKHVDISQLNLPAIHDYSNIDANLSGSDFFWDDYMIGERIDHLDGMTIDDSDHTLATKLYQNNARVHFDAVYMQTSRFQQRLMYGGHVISICRALSFNGLQNALRILAINGGKHIAPCFAGDTIYAISEIVDKQKITGREDIACLRIKTWGVKNIEVNKVSSIFDNTTQVYDESVVLELDYTVLMPCKKH
jgi:2-methylfumaryl-CoA hydratase